MYNCRFSPYDKDIAVRRILNRQISTLLICGKRKSENSEGAKGRKAQPGTQEEKRQERLML
jgi:hypothetical protein